MLIRIKYKNNIITNYGQIILNMRKQQQHILANFLFLWPWPLVENLGNISIFSGRQISVQHISIVTSK